MTAILFTLFFIAILFFFIKKLNSGNSSDKKSNTNHKFIEITNEEMSNLKDEDVYNDEAGEPFIGILYSQATEDSGRIQCEYKNGKRDGEYTEDATGEPDKIFRTKYYKNGLKQGAETIYYEKYKDGRSLKSKNKYDDPSMPAELSKMMSQLTEKHDVMVKMHYKLGLLHGKWIDYNWNGGINHEINFNEGKKDGVWKLYFKNSMGTGQGALKKLSIFKEDKHISSTYYDFDNDKISKEEALNDEEWGGEGWEENESFD